MKNNETLHEPQAKYYHKFVQKAVVTGKLSSLFVGFTTKLSIQIHLTWDWRQHYASSLWWSINREVFKNGNSAILPNNLWDCVPFFSYWETLGQLFNCSSSHKWWITTLLVGETVCQHGNETLMQSDENQTRVYLLRRWTKVVGQWHGIELPLK